jgi:dolichol-phosphate mannosyltransferase
MMPFVVSGPLSPGHLPETAADRGLALSVVIPCFNEEAVLAELERRVSQVCESVAPEAYEIVLVDDGSRDRTGEIIAEMAARNPRIVGIELSRNFGHQTALTAGLSFARGSRIFVIDADLQDPPELLPDMMALMEKGANIVYGKRRERRGESRFKRATASVFYRLLDRLTDVPIPLDTGDFRLMDRETLNVFLTMPEQFRFVRGMIAWIGLKQVEFPYDRQERFAGATKYPFRKMLLFAIDAITGFSIAPLRFAFFLSVATILLALGVAAYGIVGWLLGMTVPGWTSLLLLFLLFSSIQLACLSIVGEYVGRTYMQTKQRPLYVVKCLHSHGGADSLARNRAAQEMVERRAAEAAG